MRIATRQDKALVTGILCESFAGNSHFKFILRKSKPEKRLRELASYAFDYGLKRNAVLITSDEAGVAIVYKYNQGGYLSDLLQTTRLVIRAFDIGKLPQIIRHEKMLKAKRPVSGEFLYFWFFCVKPQRRGRSAPREIRDYMIKRSYREQLPVIAETTAERNKLLFEKFGFRVYDQLENRLNNLHVWFLVRLPDLASDTSS